MFENVSVNALSNLHMCLFRNKYSATDKISFLANELMQTHNGRLCRPQRHVWPILRET